MLNLRKTWSAALAVAALTAAPGYGNAQESAHEMMIRALGTADNVSPVVAEAFEHAALPLTKEQRALALKCWTDSSCETGHGTLTVAYADGFGENVWRRVTAMEFIEQALTYPDVKKIVYTSARGDASKAISDMRAYIAQKVDVIVVFADAGAALLPTAQEAKEAGILVVVHNGTTVGGTPGVDFLSSVAEDICKLGSEFVRVIADNAKKPTSIVELGGTPGNPLSAAWQACSDKEIAKHDNVKFLGKADTNWTQEGTFQAVSGFLSQYGEVGGYVYEYADGFRGALRAYDAAGKKPDMLVALRTDEQGLFCDWEKAKDSNFRIFYSSGQNYQSRIALTAAMMKHAGKDVAPSIDVPFSMKEVRTGQCNPDLPLETSVSTLIDKEMLKAMFAK